MGCFRFSGKSNKNAESKNKIKNDENNIKHDDRMLKSSTGIPEMNQKANEKELNVKGDNLQLDTREPNSSQNEETRGSKTPTFTFSELRIATGNFGSNCLLGEGGFGKVYKGYLQRIDQVVAIKQLDLNGIQGTREFLVEVMTLGLVDHPNLVKLLGYCAEGVERLLVYEYMPLGSLEYHLHDVPPNRKRLDWNTRMKIAAGAANGLEYLHDKMSTPIIYRDLKCSNILLGEDYHPKLSDFGLAKVGPVGDKSHVSTRVMGTYGYCAPDYAMTGQLTFKSDIYSFGVVLLELITGRKAYDPTQPVKEQYLVGWARTMFKDRRQFSKMVDPSLEGQYPTRGLYQAIAIAAMCVQEQPNMRPVVSDIVSALNYLSAQIYTPKTRTPSPEHSCMRGGFGSLERGQPSEYY